MALSGDLNTAEEAADTASGSSPMGILKRLRTLLGGIGAIAALRPRNKTLTAVYYGTSGVLVVLAAAHAATAGFFWIVNTDAVRKVRIKRVVFNWGPVAATAFASSPRVTMERVTFTGAPSGAQITPAKRLTTDAIVGSIRTASTGLALTAGPVIDEFLVGAVLTAVGIAVPSDQEFVPRSDDESLVELAQNEGVVFRQADAGTAADTRICIIDFELEEY